MEIAGEIRRDEAPPVGVRATAVHEQQPPLDRTRRFARPEQIVERAAVYDAPPRLLGTRDGPAKPFGSRRANLEVIAQEKLQRAGGSVPVRKHVYRISLAMRTSVDAICKLPRTEPLKLPATLEAPPARLR